MNIDLEDRVRGVLFGQAVGDALGFGTEFLSREDAAQEYPEGLRRYEQITRFPPWPTWRPGDWTDDTDQMLCILDSLLDRRTVDVADIAARLHHWAVTDGFGMGQTVYAVVHNPRFVEAPLEVAQEVWEQTGRQGAANGGVMRTSPLGIWNYRDAEQVRAHAELVCRITHPDPRCIGSCAAVCLAIREFLCGADDPAGVVERVAAGVLSYHPEMEETFTTVRGPSLAAFDLDEGMHPGEPNRIGYTLKALGSAFWALSHANSIREGLQAVIHEGGDADTNAAVAGALLGARFGASAIPREWVEGLVHRGELERRVEQLLGLLGSS